MLVLLPLLVLLVASRLWQLEIDAPETVIPGYTGEAHFRDEPAKAHEARNQAKWGEWTLSEYDDYAFWRAQSPAWVWGECAWFRGFGVGLLQARLFVVVHSLLALALLIWLAKIRHGLPAAVATGALLGFNWAYLVYSRLALMEGALIGWLIVVTVMLSQLERQPARAGLWSALASLAMLVVCTIKQTGLLLLPVFAVALLVLGLRAAGRVAGLDDAAASRWRWLAQRLRRRQGWSALLALVMLGLVLGALVLSPEYQERLAFNAEHFTGANKESIWTRAAATLVRGLASARLQLMFMRLAPLMLWLATVELARILILAWRSRRARRRGEPEPPRVGLLEQGPDAIDRWMLAWAIFALLANLASPHRAIRFQLILLPPAAWLAGALIGRAWAHAWPSRWRTWVRAGLLVLALLGLGATAARFVVWMQTSEDTTARVGDQLVALIGDREAVVIGEFAAQAVFETDYRHFYVRPHQFNDSEATLRGLGITHVVAEYPRSDRTFALLRRRVPDLLVGSRKLGTIRFRQRTLEVWELAGAREPDERSR